MYIRAVQNGSGAYPAPQSTPAEGLLYFPDDLLAKFIEYSGFVTLTIEGEAVKSIKKNTKAYNAWQAFLAEQETQEEEKPAEDETATVWDELDKAYTEGVNGAYDQ